MSTQKATRAAMAAAAALLFTSVATTANAADEAKVKCEGVNSCKGHVGLQHGHQCLPGPEQVQGPGLLAVEQGRLRCGQGQDEDSNSGGLCASWIRHSGAYAPLCIYGLSIPARSTASSPLHPPARSVPARRSRRAVPE